LIASTIISRNPTNIFRCSWHYWLICVYEFFVVDFLALIMENVLQYIGDCYWVFPTFKLNSHYVYYVFLCCCYCFSDVSFLSQNDKKFFIAFSTKWWNRCRIESCLINDNIFSAMIIIEESLLVNRTNASFIYSYN